jgi:hypothetical protein
MPKWMQDFAERLERIDMPLEGDQLRRAAELALLYSSTPERLHDLALMAIAVESYRRPEVDVPAWV